jgi:uncharacterized protein YjbI with pentapeptide repeats
VKGVLTGVSPCQNALACGSPDWTRTSNPLINSQMLCQLSYRGPLAALERLADHPSACRIDPDDLGYRRSVVVTTIRTGADFDGDELTGQDFSGVRAGDVRMLECQVADCRMDEAKLTGIHVVDSSWMRVAASGLTAPHSSWRDSSIRDSRFGLLDLSASTLLRLTITDAKIDYLNLRAATIREVVLTRVSIGEMSLSDAHGTSLTLTDCTLETLELHNGRLAKIDVSTSTVTRIDGLDSLRGVILSLNQVLDLAPSMAKHLGATLAE